MSPTPLAAVVDSRPMSRRGLLLGSGALAVAASLSACAPKGGSASAGATPVEVSTDIASAPEQILTVWDQEVRGGQNEQMQSLHQPALSPSCCG